MNKHVVGFFQCTGCGSLQTEPPTWLDEAYDPMNERYDTGQVLRSIFNAAFVRSLYGAAGFNGRVVDYGCGSGLLVRLLRDVGIDAWGHEPNGLPRFALGFRTDDLAGADIVNLAEVAEHFDRPAESFERIFAGDPPLVVVQTQIFKAPDPAWDYLAPEHGQHVFFYSEKALAQLAEKRDRSLLVVSGFLLFAAPHVVPKLVDIEKRTLRPPLQAGLQSQFFELCQSIAKHGYEYAARDSAQLSAAFRPAE